MDNILLNDIVDIVDVLNDILDNILDDILDILNNILGDILDILNNFLDILFQTYEAEEGERIVIMRTTECLFFSFEACVDLRLRERNREREES